MAKPSKDAYKSAMETLAAGDQSVVAEVQSVLETIKAATEKAIADIKASLDAYPVEAALNRSYVRQQIEAHYESLRAINNQIETIQNAVEGLAPVVPAGTAN